MEERSLRARRTERGEAEGVQLPPCFVDAMATCDASMTTLSGRAWELGQRVSKHRDSTDSVVRVDLCLQGGSPVP